MQSTHLHIDYETFSEIPLDNSYTYAAHPSTELLWLGWAVGDGPVNLVDIHGGESIPPMVKELYLDPTVYVHAFNAVFERLITSFKLDIHIPHHRWLCSMCRSYSFGFKGSLEDVLKAAGLGVQKDKDGPRLINKFSKPQTRKKDIPRYTKVDAPGDYHLFGEYCRKDVEVERTLTRFLDQMPVYPGEHDLYVVDQIINDAGVPVDIDLIDAAIKISAEEKRELKKQLSYITGLENPNSNQQMESWLWKMGVKVSNMQKETLQNALKEEHRPIIKSVLEKKLDLAKTSVKKYNAFKACVGDDERVRGMFQFCGAGRTSRWAGRTVQLHNLARGGNTTKNPVLLADNMTSLGREGVNLLYGNVMQALSDVIRCTITARKGGHLIVSDLGSIESRVVGWIADCLAINRIFAQNKDTYKVFAQELFHKAYEDVTRDERNFAKPPVLGCAYRLGVEGLILYAASMGVTMTEEESKRCINLFRYELFPEIPKFWDWCSEAVFHTTLTGGICEGPHGLRTERWRDFLLLWLPSGRAIPYFKPMIRPTETPWGEIRDAFTFMGIERDKYIWTRISAHNGFLTENIVQAIARDVLAVWLKRVIQAGYKVVLHTHDELAVEYYGPRDPEEVLDHINKLIEIPVPWSPGLLLKAGGFVTKRYRKD